MPLDVDFIAIEESLKTIKRIAGNIPHGKRAEICDIILEFEEKLKKKYKK